MIRYLTLLVGVLASDLCAPLLKAGSVEDALARLEESEIADPNECLLHRCLLKLIEENKWEIATALSSKAIDTELALDEEGLKQRAVDTKKKIEKVLQALEGNGSKLQTIAPAFQWAQSPEKVFLDIKFSHRFDSPGCLELTDTKVNITETHLKLSALCVYSSHRMKYNLDLELFAAVDAEASSHSFASKGRCSVTLVKNETAAWTLPMKGKKPANLQIWWEMKERFKKEMNKLTGEIDEDEQREKDKSGLGDLLDNPNVVIKDSFVNGKKYDNSKERGK